MKRSQATKELTTPTLTLRPFKRRDVAPLMEAVSASLSDLQRWLPWAHAGYSRTDAIAFVRESMSAWREGRAYDFTVRSTQDPDRHLGNVSVWATNRTGLVGEIGYWVRSDELGKGIATQAAARVTQLGFEELGMHRLTLRIAVGNTSSERVAEKLGYAQEGLLRQEVRVGGVWLDHTAWGLLRSEFETEQFRYREEGWLK
jgi:RimJ/RimL family protein N-acetyltransferase